MGTLFQCRQGLARGSYAQLQRMATIPHSICHISITMTPTAFWMAPFERGVDCWECTVKSKEHAKTCYFVCFSLKFSTPPAWRDDDF